MSDSTVIAPEHKSAVGRGGHRIDASRNMWTAAGFKVDSVSTDVAWGKGRMFMPSMNISTSCSLRSDYDHKILTSARNGDLLMWDLNKLGPSKFG